jgi:hypothetical protein
MSATVAPRVSPKRFLLLVVLAFVAFAMLPSGAAAGNFDEEKMGCGGEDPATCPTGTVGQPYAMTIYLVPPDGGRGEDFGCATFHVTAGTFPPGLSINQDEGTITGTPTEAGTFGFYLTVHYQKNPGCYKLSSDDRFIIQINPGVPKLTIGPESAPVGTVGSPYSLQMTANLSDAKTWSISAGALPAGVSLNSSTGAISGTPTSAGSSNFTVQATIDSQRTDTKSLTIVVRAPLAITSPAAFNGTRTARTEVGLLFSATLNATGGLGPYTWTQSGSLPDGIEFDVSDGSVSGQAETPGTYRFTLTVADAEGRNANYSGTIVVAKRLTLLTKKLRDGRVGRLYRFKLAQQGGMGPFTRRVKRGPLPKGVRFNATTGSFVGIPVKAGIWVITVEVVDALRVKATATVTLLVKPSVR